MVQGQQQHMVIIGHHHQAPAQQRAAFKVERRRSFAVDQRVQGLLRLRVAPQVLHLQRQHLFGRHDQHLGLVTLLGEAAAQSFMPRHNARQGPLQRLHMQLPTQPQADGNVVGGVGPFHQRQEPQALLGEGQRHVIITVGRQDIRQGAATGLGQYLGDRRQFGVGKQVAQCQFDAQPLAHLGHHAHGQQRMPAQLKEMVVTPHTLHLQHLGPDLRQHGFDFALGHGVLTGKYRGHVRRWQSLAVEFAIGGQWQCVELHERDGHHVVRQMRHQVGANFGQRQRVPLRIFGEIGHQPLFTHHCHRFQNAGQLVELGFDFSQFDAHATDFHLVIVAPQVVERAVRQPAHQVAGAVHAPRIERVAHETLGGQFRAVEVTACHALAAHVQLPRHPQRHRALVGVEHVDLGIGDGLADMQRLARLDFAGSGHHRGFGGPVVVDQLKALRPPELAQAVATDQQGAQGRVLDVLAEGVFRHRRRQKAHVQRLRAPPGQQCVDIFAALMGRWQVQGGAHTQRRPHFPGHRVKAETGHTGGVPAGAQVEGAAMPVHQVGDRVVFHHHPFGQAGGAGGVDHIGQVRRAHGDGGVARRVVLPGEAVQVDHRHFQGRQALQ
ncbi:hypothetical protein PFL603g_06260 [Pseudomonas fluorescens]|uniref:Uncharacterized protein n=1 Tax=Pseudomonas fluorescens TaxID=294 RepID=A0A109KIE3_PSEFL|nr:hypothetical protein PFL603g_06260 [Pseudomonas fluorescens]